MQKAKSNCWTCKERKIGCDKTTPTCINCRRGNRVCKGYGVKLAWPQDKYDGRRKQKSYDADALLVAPRDSKGYLRSKEGGFVFLNTFVGDLEGKRWEWVPGVGEMITERGVSVSREREIGNGLGLYRLGNLAGVEERDGMLLGYYDSVLSRMVTTIDDETNGFRLSLIPMALSSSDASSRSLLQATLALSSFHLGKQDEALKYKVRAIKSLSESFSSNVGVTDAAVQMWDGASRQSRMKQFAACMMLCVYSVFDASDTTWHLHLQGAKSIADSLSSKERESPAYEFMEPWFDYHETFSGFSHDKGGNGESHLAVEDVKLPESTPETRKIIGLLGCSTELLRLISCTNNLRTISKTLSQASHQNHTHEYLRLSFDLRARLLNIAQEIRILPGETTGTINHHRITLTAEFYHLAALLYLYQVAPPQTIPTAHTISDLVRQSFDILDQLVVCTSPWPLFVLACSATQDSDRIKVLDKLDTGAKARRVGNYDVIKSLVQAVWKQKDLGADEKSKGGVDWRDLVEEGGCVPSFI